MNTQIRYTVFSFVVIWIVLTLLLAFPEVSRSRAKARAVVPAAELRAVTPATEEETVTLSPANLKTWEHYYDWAHEKTHCGPHPEDIAGSIVAGIKVSEGCPSGSHTVYRGTVWFDLSTIMSKAPPLHVSIKSAKLHFNQSGECPGELLYGTADWLKGYSDNELVPGDPRPLATLPSGIRTGTLMGGLLAKPCVACSIEVGTFVNNWLRGEEHGGYANYGFVFKGMLEADVFYGGNPSCVSRYSDFSLTLTYAYDKAPDSYPLVCRGTDSLKVIAVDGPAGSKGIGFKFIPGTGPAKGGLLPGQCTWLDRGMRPGEPATLAQPLGGAVDWIKDLNSPSNYWTFKVYNAGEQLLATASERSKRPDMDVAMPGGPLGGKTAFAETNYALASNLGVASASSSYPGSAPSGANDGDRKGLNIGKGGIWASATTGFPAWLEIAFSGSKKIDEIDVFTQQDNYTSPVEPTEDMTFSSTTGYGLTGYEVQYWDGSAWTKVLGVPGGSVTGNNKVWRRFTFSPITTTKIRVLTNASRDGYSRLIEVEAWGS
jgi:F5/8 type C domain-containing protein